MSFTIFWCGFNLKGLCFLTFVRQIPQNSKEKLVFPISFQDFVIYLLAGPNISFGRHSEGDEGSKPDFVLFATDILPRHCCFERHSSVSATTLHPGEGSLVTRNGEVLQEEVQLHPGDVVCLGHHYLFLFKDPLAAADKVRGMEMDLFKTI